MTDPVERFTNSDVFGKVKNAPRQKRLLIDWHTKMFPLDTFQALNLLLNEKGFCLQLHKLDKKGTDNA